MAQNQSPEVERHLPLPAADFEILLSLHEGEKHGYGIIRDVATRTEGAIKLGTSTLYATIRRLLKSKIVADAGRRSKEPSGGPPRRYYRLTELGRRVLRLEAVRLQNVAAAAREYVLDEAGQ